MLQQQILPGFSNPVHNSQQWYRAVLDSMSRPGKLSMQGNALVAKAPYPMTPVSASVALSLLDHETYVWIHESSPESIERKELATWLQFHCGCPFVAEPERAMFAFIADGKNLPDLTCFAIGTPEFPDRSTTLIIQVQSLAGGEKYSLQGPGIDTEKTLKVSGLKSTFWQAQQANNVTFPQGFDTILTAPEGVVCIPRSVSIRRLK